GNKSIRVGAGQQERLPLRFELPATLAPGQYQLNASFRFSHGENQQDNFLIDVVSSPSPLKGERAGVRGEGGPKSVTAKTAVFDPKGETSALLNRIGIQSTPVSADTDLSSYDTLIVGKSS